MTCTHMCWNKTNAIKGYVGNPFSSKDHPPLLWWNVRNTNMFNTELDKLCATCFAESCHSNWKTTSFYFCSLLKKPRIIHLSDGEMYESMFFFIKRHVLYKKNLCTLTKNCAQNLHSNFEKKQIYNSSELDSVCS